MKTVSKFFSQIRAMEGKTFRINGSTVDEQIKRVTLSTEEGPDDIIVQTSIRTRHLSDVPACQKFIKDAIEVPMKPAPIVKKEEAVSILPDNELSEMDKLNAILMGQIDKIDKNPGYLKQATQINNTAKNIIAIKTLRMRAAELYMRHNKKKKGSEDNDF